jgi:hypothetical protein
VCEQAKGKEGGEGEGRHNGGERSRLLLRTSWEYGFCLGFG